MNVIVRKKSVYISASHILLIQIEHLDVRIIMEDHTSNDLVANLQRFSCAVNFYVFTHLYDLSGSLVSKSYRDQSERVFLKFMCICSTDAASFYFYKDVSVSHFRDRELFNIIMLKRCQHSNMSCLRNSLACCRS